MNRSLLDILCCPRCQGSLTVAASSSPSLTIIEDGELRCDKCSTIYRVRNGVPRFLDSHAGSSSFGFQWRRFGQTQLDSHTGQPISRDRFFRQSNWSADDLRGKRVLDVGCGAGRFVEVALSTGAQVVAVDASLAVDACWHNHGHNPRLNVLQADIYGLPFRPQSFDFVYCFGVLQHTPDVRRSFFALPPQLRPGGRLAVDVYPALRLNVLWPKYWLRPLTKRIPADRMLPLVRGMVDVLLPLSIAIGRIPGVGRKLRYAIPVANYDGILPLNRQQLHEWAVLDTLDMLSPAHDHPQTVDTLKRWFDTAQLQQVEVFRAGLVVGRAVKA